METRFFTSIDGNRIAYSIAGKGPGLFLLHGGFVQSRGVWQELSYVSELISDYTVVIMDILGHGESDRPGEEDAYQIDMLVGHVLGIAEQAGIDKFFLWGFSLGGSIALHVAANSHRLIGAIVCGTFFGESLLNYAWQQIPDLECAVQAKNTGQLDKLELTPEERFFVEIADLDVALAFYKAIASWPPVEPASIRCPTMIYAGSRDELIVSNLQQQESRIRDAGMEFHIIPGLDHFQEITEKDTVLPYIKAFLLRFRR